MSTKQHYQRRVSTLRKWMEQNQVGLCVVAKPANQFYICGFRAHIYSRLILTVVTADEVIALVPLLEEEHALHSPGVDRVISYREDRSAHGDSLKELRELAAKLGDKAMGIETGVLPLGVFEGLLGDGSPNTMGIAGAKRVDVGPYLAIMRTIKDDGELAHIRTAARYVSIAVEKTKQALAAGRTELEVEYQGTLDAIREMREPALEGYGFMILTASGIERTVLPHAFTCNRTFTSPDLLIHRRQLAFKGYGAECERTFFVGRPTPEQSRLFGVMCRAQEAAIMAVRPGVSAAAIDRASRAVYEAEGLLPYVLHRTGHGLGLEPHELPFLREDDPTTILQPGMAFSIEPGIYVPGVGGFRHSDSVLVTESGYEVLTTGGKTLEQCTVL